MFNIDWYTIMEKMNWERLISAKRFGMERYYDAKHDRRSVLQRDYDRLIFSAPFRRLQNKTQVFPLPGSVFVHNRLTHSLEVACVGRSLGYGVSDRLKERYGAEGGHFDEIGSIVAAACLAHDMGNPPFGHSGENAIATYFSEGKGITLKERHGLTDAEWADFTHFDGNANAFRLLTHKFNGRREGGFAMTYSTLASIVKYPFEAVNADGKKCKFGFFQSEKEAYGRIAGELGIADAPEGNGRKARYPLVYLVEAADDICYQVMDVDDAFKLKLLSFEQTRELLMAFLPEERQQRAERIFETVKDENERVGYLRSTVIGILIDECVRVFAEHEDEILAGKFKGALIDCIGERPRAAYRQMSKLAVGKIYRAQMVLDIELAGYRIITELMDDLMSAVFEPEKSYSRQLLNRIPAQYDVQSESAYGRILSVIDYVSGMTDIYALDLYRKITGMNLPTL